MYYLYIGLFIWRSYGPHDEIWEGTANPIICCYFYHFPCKIDTSKKTKKNGYDEWSRVLTIFSKEESRKVNLKNTLIEALGIQINTLEKGKVVATMPVDERTKQPFGLLHGGASVALAETVASIGAYELVNKETEAVAGLEINANHVRGKREGMVTAIATVLHHGKTTMVWDIKIVDEENKLICISRCTMAVLKIK
jgi:1,4-dihydroxy-2-naphthoyl-CoA hydrolase